MTNPKRSYVHPSNRPGFMERPRVSAWRAIVWPEAKIIAGPQLQKEMGGEVKVAHLFDERFWTLQRLEGLSGRAVMWSLTEREWTLLARRWLHEEASLAAANGAEERNRYAKTPTTRSRLQGDLRGFKSNPFSVLRK